MGKLVTFVDSMEIERGVRVEMSWNMQLNNKQQPYGFVQTRVDSSKL